MPEAPAVVATGADATTPSRSHEGMRARSQLGVLVFLASDLMLFAAFFAAYYLLRTGVSEWPPADVELDTIRSGIATLVLVGSSFTMIAADRSLGRRDLVGAGRWTVATVLLGALFLTNQIVEYSTLPFSASDHAYGSIYWLLTGLHSAHVTAGLLVLLAIAVRTRRVERPDDLHTWMSGGSAFWHLVDVVWVAVFLTIWVVR